MRGTFCSDFPNLTPVRAVRVVSEFVTQQTTKRKWAVAAGLFFSHMAHTHTHIHTCTHTHTHTLTHHRHTQVNISHLQYLHTYRTHFTSHTHTHTTTKISRTHHRTACTSRIIDHHHDDSYHGNKRKTLTRSSTTSSILARAPSMHCWAPFRTTLSKVVPERGKLIRTPPFSADMSCTSCECGECGESGESGEGVCWACG